MKITKTVTYHKSKAPMVSSWMKRQNETSSQTIVNYMGNPIEGTIGSDTSFVTRYQ